MKFICKKCCEEDDEKPCEFHVPKGAISSKQEAVAGLTLCPYVGYTYNPHKKEWIPTGNVTKAEWEMVK